MPLHAIDVETAPNPTASIFLLHGLGADATDLLPIARELDLSACGPARFVFPAAPVRPVTLNAGMPMPAWYDILGSEVVLREDEAGLRSSLRHIEGLIARERARGVPAARIVLGGFSQGCAMSLLVGLRHAERLGGIVGLSGYLPLAHHTAAERSAVNAGLPIFLAHGRHDGVVPYASAMASRAALDSLGYAVEWHDYPMEHSICEAEIGDLNRWLVRVLS